MQRNTRTQRGFRARWSPFALVAIPTGLVLVVLIIRFLSAKPARPASSVKSAAHPQATAKLADALHVPAARKRPRVSALGLAGSTLGLLVVISLAVLGSGGTFAYLNAGVSASAGATVKSGNAALTSSGSSLALTGLYPGVTKSAPFTVTNSGTIPLVLRVSTLTAPGTSTTLSQAITVRIDVTSSAATCTDGTGVPATSAWSGTFASSTAASLGSTLAAGATATVCLSTTLPTGASSAAQSGSVGSFSVTIGGYQS